MATEVRKERATRMGGSLGTEEGLYSLDKVIKQGPSKMNSCGSSLECTWSMLSRLVNGWLKKSYLKQRLSNIRKVVFYRNVP